MKRNKKYYLPLLIVLFITVISCKKENTYKVDGIVVNKITQEPLEGVKVRLQDGITVGGIMSNEVDSKAETLTASDGSFSIKITTKSNHAVLYLSKEAYEYKLEGSTSDTRHYGINNEHTSVKLGMDGIAYFNSPFYKISSSQMDDDSLNISLLSYDDLSKLLNSREPFLRIGKGAFFFRYEDSKTQLKGDRYLRYKLEYTNNGAWQTKIDSVFLPTSLEVYRDTIFY